MDGGTCSSQSSPVRRDARAPSTTTTRVGSAPMPPTNPQDAPNRCSSAAALAQAHRVGCVVAELQRLVDDDAWRSDRPSTPGRPRRATGRMRAASVRRALLQQLVGGDEHRQIPRRPCAPAGRAALLGDAGKRAVPGGRSWRSTPPTIRSAPAAMASNVARSASGRPRRPPDPAGPRSPMPGGAPPAPPAAAPFRVRRPHPAGGAVGTSRYRHPTNRARSPAAGRYPGVTMQPGIARPRPGLIWLHHE